MAVPVIDIKDTNKLAEAMQRGIVDNYGYAVMYRDGIDKVAKGLTI